MDMPQWAVEGGLVLGDYFFVLINGENAGYALDRTNGKVVDVLSTADNDLVNPSPVRVGARQFALTTTRSLETYAIGDCAP